MTRRYAPSLFFVPAFLLVCIAGSANTLAQTGPELLLAPFPKELKLDANAYVGFRDTGHDKATDADFRLDIFETQGRFRLNPGDVASPRIGYSFSYLNIDSSIAGMPEHLVNQSIGFAMPIAQQDGWIVGFSVAAGYAGDSFFGDGDAFYGKAAIGVFKQLSPTDTIAIAIDYNGNRTFRPDLPLPGFAYIKRVDERLLLTLGIPVTSIEWQPIDKLRVQFGYLLVDNVTARVGYEVFSGFEVFGLAAQRSGAFFLDGLDGNKERLLLQERNAEIGVTYHRKSSHIDEPDIELTAAIGYSWNTEFSTGWDQSDSELLADVSDEPYIRFALDVRF
ncbi:hypothetical protein [Humisphaera borealis]|uniref:DUF3187 family protein n=1 Tax=Humisphaera borealis TaxID=2807512 RepID=A0A7M2X361_9BACT|nr:hypothetical protein [Humisphaera borealis]QOV92217.1 hypothetical protein IPV69_13015 [Humisphaera borealis]